MRSVDASSRPTNKVCSSASADPTAYPLLVPYLLFNGHSSESGRQRARERAITIR